MRWFNRYISSRLKHAVSNVSRVICNVERYRNCRNYILQRYGHLSFGISQVSNPCRLRITIRVCEQMEYIVDFASREFSMRIVETAITFRNNFKITKRLNWSITEMQRVFLIIYNSLQSRSTGIDSASTQSKNIRCKNMAEARAKFNYVVNMSRGMALLTRFIS